MKDKEKLIEDIKAACQQSSNGKLSCAKAQALQAEYEVENGQMARICDEIDVKIFGCLLGCFD